MDNNTDNSLPPWLDVPLGELLAQSDRLPHALLITGRPGIGKTQLAERLVAALLCEDHAPGTPACSRCPACDWVAQGNHPDLRRVTLADESTERAEGGTKARKPSLEIRVDQVRGLAEFLAVGSHRGGRRVVLLHPADALNHVAANALLKSLEEPAPAVHFVLVSGQPQSLPATILSRCQRRVVPPPEPAVARAWLMASTGASAEDADAWLAASGGAPLLAAELAQPDRAAVHRVVVEAVSRMPDTGFMTAADALANLAPAVWLAVLQGWVADLARTAAGHRPVRFVASHGRLRALAARTALDRLATCARWLDEEARLATHPMNARLFCERVMLGYSAIFV